MIWNQNEFEDVLEFASKYSKLIGVIAAFGLFTVFLIIWFWGNKTLTNSRESSERQNVMDLRPIERPPAWRNREMEKTVW